MRSIDSESPSGSTPSRFPITLDVATREIHDLYECGQLNVATATPVVDGYVGPRRDARRAGLLLNAVSGIPWSAFDIEACDRTASDSPWLPVLQAVRTHVYSHGADGIRQPVSRRTHPMPRFAPPPVPPWFQDQEMAQNLFRAENSAQNATKNTIIAMLAEEDASNPNLDASFDLCQQLSRGFASEDEKLRKERNDLLKTLSVQALADNYRLTHQ